MKKEQIKEICTRFENNQDSWEKILFTTSTGTKSVWKADGGYIIDSDDFLVIYTDAKMHFIAFEDVREIVFIAPVDIK